MSQWALLLTLYGYPVWGHSAFGSGTHFAVPALSERSSHWKEGNKGKEQAWPWWWVFKDNGENVCVVKRRTWGVVIYREERKVNEGHVTEVGCWAWDILQYAWLWKPWVLHLMKFMVWGGFGISIKWQRERCFSVSIANGRNSWWRGDHAWFHFFSSWILSFLLYMQVHNLKIRLAFNFLISHFPLILLY